MRADCEVRVGTVSEGMSRLARLVLLQRQGCLRAFILNLSFSCQRVLPLPLHREADKSLGHCHCPEGVSALKTKGACHTRQAKSDT